MNGENFKTRPGSLSFPRGESPGSTRPDAIPATEIDITKDRLGDVLGNRRQQLGLKIEEVAEDIKIRADYLRAIEAEAFDRMPTTEYGRLFLKSYAERLGLSVNEIYALYDLHHRPAFDSAPKVRAGVENGLAAGPTLRIPLPKPQTSKVWLYVLVAVIIAAVLVAIIMKATGTRETVSDSTELSVTE